MTGDKHAGCRLNLDRGEDKEQFEAKLGKIVSTKRAPDARRQSRIK